MLRVLFAVILLLPLPLYANENNTDTTDTTTTTTTSTTTTTNKQKKKPGAFQGLPSLFSGNPPLESVGLAAQHAPLPTPHHQHFQQIIGFKL